MLSGDIAAIVFALLFALTAAGWAVHYFVFVRGRVAAVQEAADKEAVKKALSGEVISVEVMQ